MDKPTLEKDIEALGHNERFIRFLDHVHSLREVEIKSFRNAGKDEVMRIAGRVDAFDEILGLAKYDEAKAKLQALLQ